MSLLLLLRMAGVSLVGLSCFHAALRRELDQGVEIERLSPLNARVFVVHTFFVASVLCALGLLTAVQPELLLAPSDLARLVLHAVVVFWIARVVIQPLIFDRVMVTGWTRSPVLRIGASLLCLGCVALHGAALLRQLEAAEPR